MRRSTADVPISVVIPVRDEGDHLAATVESIVSTRRRTEPLEIVVVDDASSDGACRRLSEDAAGWERRGIRLKVLRLPEHVGIPCARNYGAAAARGRALFITDAHVRLSAGWDELLVEELEANVVLSATIVDSRSKFAAYGCALDFPSLGTRWILDPPDADPFVPIAPCGGTAILASLFLRLGGYDALMPLYGSAEPEFSVRLWLAGARIKVVPDLVVRHVFRERQDFARFQEAHRGLLVHNALRFAFLHLPSELALQVLRHHAVQYPALTQWALAQICESNVWFTRQSNRQRFPRDFRWFARRFCMRDAAGHRIGAPHS